ncbi:hypothetical protein GAYE_PCTG52G1267 [Galdieria yellowstonensis]|uniref:Ribosomal protein L28 n=1 Tax=Galdieria yellowstonensis TaxID=3028027 RepID=A0AAV9I7C5_9RHOD|nr:hypothetical protein GAYE_PCTG52G1267 [Galdieria yellowstonensis]
MEAIPRVRPPKLCKRRGRGLFDGEMTRFGEKAAPSGQKHRRRFRPNIHRLSLYSKTFDKWFFFRISQSAMKKVKEWGGLDEYLVRTPDDIILYPFAIRLKYEILKKRAEMQKNETAGTENTQGLASVDSLTTEDISKQGILWNR